MKPSIGQSLGRLNDDELIFMLNFFDCDELRHCYAGLIDEIRRELVARIPVRTSTAAQPSARQGAK